MGAELRCVEIFGSGFTLQVGHRGWLEFVFAVMADKEENTGAWSRCPVWDGSPVTWRAFKREMAWWCSSLDLEGTKKYNLAARSLLRQSGTVRQRGEEFLPEELEYQKEVRARDPESGEELASTPEDPLAGLNKLKAKEALNGQSVLDRRGTA